MPATIESYYTLMSADVRPEPDDECHDFLGEACQLRGEDRREPLEMRSLVVCVGPGGINLEEVRMHSARFGCAVILLRDMRFGHIIPMPWVW